MKNTINRYFFRVFTALSVLLNVILGGEQGQTFSARNWEWKKQGKPNLAWLIDFICLPIESGHCSHAWVWWKTRKW